MSAWLVAATGIAYSVVAAEQWVRGNVPIAIVWTGYAFSQAGLYAITKGAN